MNADKVQRQKIWHEDELDASNGVDRECTIEIPVYEDTMA